MQKMLLFYKIENTIKDYKGLSLLIHIVQKGIQKKIQNNRMHLLVEKLLQRDWSEKNCF